MCSSNIDHTIDHTLYVAIAAIQELYDHLLAIAIAPQAAPLPGEVREVGCMAV